MHTSWRACLLTCSCFQTDMRPIGLFSVFGWLLLSGPLHATAATASDELASLQQEVQELKQLLSVVLGAESIEQLTEQGFLPTTANTQRLIARQPELWPQHFTFLSAVAADSSVTCSHVMTDKAKLAGGPLYLVLGDQAGRLYFFTPQGHLLHEYVTGAASSITALSSDLVAHNETQLLVGQHDGTVTVLSVAHEHPRIPDGNGIRSVSAVMVSTAADRAQQKNDTDISSHAQPIRHIMFGRSSARRMLLAVDGSGRVVLMTASSGHMLMVQQTTAGPPLAVNLNSQFQLVVQHEAATSILLMKRGRSLVTRRCFGLAHPMPTAHEHEQPGSTHEHEHGDRLVSAVFDPTRAFRAFGVTAGGELLVLVVPSGMAAHQCRVLQRVSLDLPPGPAHLVMGKGTLILLHSAGVAAFNLSAHKVQLPGSYMVSHTWQQLWRLYGLSQQYKQLLQPLSERDAADAGDSSRHLSSSSSSSSVIAGSEEAGDGQGGLGSSSSSSSETGSVLHTSGWDAPLMTAAAAQGLLLLPFGNRGMAVFAVGHGVGTAGSSLGTVAAGGGGVSGSSRASSSGVDVNWVRLLQPLVVIMMIIVGVWQFVRASNRSNLTNRRAARYGTGLAGFDDMGVMSRSQGLAASYRLQGEMGGQRRPQWGMGDDDEGLGSFSSLDREFGPYGGPRARREQQTAGPLGALTARRRARAAMFSGRQGDREQGERERGGGGLRYRGSAGQGIGRGQAVQQQQRDRVVGQAGRRVLFNDVIAEEEEEVFDILQPQQQQDVMQQQQQPEECDAQTSTDEGAGEVQSQAQADSEQSHQRVDNSASQVDAQLAAVTAAAAAAAAAASEDSIADTPGVAAVGTDVDGSGAVKGIVASQKQPL